MDLIDGVPTGEILVNYKNSFTSFLALRVGCERHFGGHVHVFRWEIVIVT
jgi:hypothetical protein